MASMTLIEFSKKYKIPKRICYKLTEADTVPEFFEKRGLHWYADDKAQGAKTFIKEYGGTAAGEAKEPPGNRLNPEVQKAKAEKEFYEARIKFFKAQQAGIKTDKMISSCVSVEAMRYYFTSFKKEITDHFKDIVKVGPTIKKLYQENKYREAEKTITLALADIFSNAVKVLQNKIEKSTETDKELVKNGDIISLEKNH
jgi:hypothetical protein